MPPPQLVPEGQISHHVVNLGDALPVRGVVLAPEPERLDVEVLPVDVDAVVGEELVDVIDQPIPGVAVPQVQEAARPASEYPLRVRVGQPRSCRDPLRFEPDQDLRMPAMRDATDGREAVRKSDRIDGPCPGLPPIPLLHVPARVHPPRVDLQTLGPVTVQEQQLVRLVRILNFPNARELFASSWGRGSLPPIRGRLWATIQRRLPHRPDRIP